MDFQKLNEERTQKRLAMQTIFETAVGRSLTDHEAICYQRAFIDCFDWLMNERIKEVEQLLNTLK